MRLRYPKLGSAHAIALLALFVALGGTVYAANKINGKVIVKNSIPGDRLKNDDVTGAQVNEGSLATVPSAKKADEATKATTATKANEAASATTAATATKANEATKAATAVKADEATKATTATKANEATSATTAGHAGTADFATDANIANGANSLGGHAPNFFLSSCSPGTLKAVVRFDIVGGNPVNPPRDTFTCDGRLINVSKTGNGEYLVDLNQLPNNQLAVVSDTQAAFDASVEADGGDEFTIKETNTDGGLTSSADQFTLFVM